MSHIAVITVVYNNYGNLDDFLASCKGQTDKDFTVYIVDNSTSKRDIPIPSFAKLLPEKNGGYAYGLNKGVEAAMKEGIEQYVCINDDVTVAPNFIESVKKSIHKHPCSLIGGKIYYYPGNEFHANRYTKKDHGNVLWYAGGRMNWAHAQAEHRGVDEIDTGQYDVEEETEFVTGCLMAFDRQLFEKVGGLDESYFLYYEDTDWNQRILKNGCHLWYDPTIVIWHKNSQSTGGSGSSLHRKYQRTNIVKFGLRYAPWRTKMHLVLNYLRGR